MSPADLLPHLIRSERGLILLGLRYSDLWVDDVMLRSLLDGWGSPMEMEHLARQMEYLIEEGLVRRAERAALGRVRDLYQITSRGRDVMHGITDHPGILVPRTRGAD